MANITLTLLTDDNREQFILDNQRAFRIGAMQEFGERDEYLDTVRLVQTVFPSM